MEFSEWIPVFQTLGRVDPQACASPTNNRKSSGLSSNDLLLVDRASNLHARQGQTHYNQAPRGTGQRSVPTSRIASGACDRQNRFQPEPNHGQHRISAVRGPERSGFLETVRTLAIRIRSADLRARWRRVALRSKPGRPRNVAGRRIARINLHAAARGSYTCSKMSKSSFSA